MRSISTVLPTRVQCHNPCQVCFLGIAVRTADSWLLKHTSATSTGTPSCAKTETLQHLAGLFGDIPSWIVKVSRLKLIRTTPADAAATFPTSAPEGSANERWPCLQVSITVSLVNFADGQTWGGTPQLNERVGIPTVAL